MCRVGASLFFLDVKVEASQGWGDNEGWEAFIP